MPMAMPASVCRHCNFLTFLIGAFGMVWFAVGLGLIVYSANLGHELAACQARLDQPQSSQTSPLPTYTKSAAVLSSASAQSSALRSSSMSNSTSEPTSELAATSTSASTSISVPFLALLSALAPDAIVSSATATSSSASSSASTSTSHIPNGIFSTLLGDRIRNAPSPSFAMMEAPSSLAADKMMLYFDHQRRQVVVTVYQPGPTPAKAKGGLSGGPLSACKLDRYLP